MKYYYVTQTKVTTINGQESGRVTSLIGYNMNEIEANEAFYSYKRQPDGFKQSSQITVTGNGSIVTCITNGMGMHTTRFKSDNEAYRKLIVVPKEFNDALAVINKHGFDAVEKGVAGRKVKVVSYQASKEL